MKFARTAAFIALVVGALSCATDDYGFRFDDETTERERGLARTSSAKWNAFTYPDHELNESPNGSWLVSFTDDSEELSSKGWIGYTKPGSILIQRGMSDDLTVRAATHEYGHMLGLRHVSDPAAIMYRTARMPASINQTDLEECQDRDSCPSIVVIPPTPVKATEEQ